MPARDKDQGATKARREMASSADMIGRYRHLAWHGRTGACGGIHWHVCVGHVEAYLRNERADHEAGKEESMLRQKDDSHHMLPLACTRNHVTRLLHACHTPVQIYPHPVHHRTAARKES